MYELEVPITQLRWAKIEKYPKSYEFIIGKSILLSLIKRLT